MNPCNQSVCDLKKDLTIMATRLSTSKEGGKDAARKPKLVEGQSQKQGITILRSFVGGFKSYNKNVAMKNGEVMKENRRLRQGEDNHETILVSVGIS
jgi:hypothetical protein